MFRIGFCFIFLLTTLFCPDSNADSGILRTGRMDHPTIRESSGLVRSGSDPNVFWTHNDGPGNQLFAIARSGLLVAEWSLVGARIVDWEDIARDDGANLYAADTGNNDRKRRELAVHRFREPNPAAGGGTVKVTHSWRLRFPGKPFDCESLIIDRGYGYLISKVTGDARAEIFRFRLDEATNQAVLESVALLPVTSPVTGADLSPDTQRLGIVCKSGAYLFEIDGVVSRASTVKPRHARFRVGQIEGCCFVEDGLLAVSETREVFLFTKEAFEAKSDQAEEKPGK